MDKKQKPYIRGLPVVKVMLTLCLFLVFASMGVKSVDALSIGERNARSSSSYGVTVPSVMDSKYTFVPKVTSKTDLETFALDGGSWVSTNWSSSNSKSFVSFKRPGDHRMGRLGVKYTNVGYYNGTPIDLKITLQDWSKYGDASSGWGMTSRQYMSFEKDNIAFSQQGYNWVDMQFDFYRAGTETKVAVAGYFTFADVDANQGIQFTKASSGAIDKYYVTSDSLLKFKIDSDRYEFYDTTDNDRSDSSYDQRYAFTIAYDRSALRFRWMTDWTKTNRPSLGAFTPSRLYYTEGYAAGEYMFYEDYKPARTAISDPTKTTDTTNLFVGDTNYYRVYHTVPTESPDYYYSSYQLHDYVDPALDVTDVRVYDDDGNNVSSRFDITTNSGNLVQAKAKSGVTGWRSFYGKQYYLRIATKVNVSKMKSAVGSNSSYLINNTGVAKVNGTNYSSNTVGTRVYNRTFTIYHRDQATGDLIQTDTHRKLNGESYSFSPRTDLKTSGGHDYTPLSSGVSGTTSTHESFTFYYESDRTVTVKHVEAGTGNVIETDSYRIKRGDSYTIHPRALKTADGDSYKGVSGTKTGTVTGDMTVYFYYEKPRKIRINHVNDDTGVPITSETSIKYDGDSFTASVRTGMSSGGYIFKPMTSTFTYTVNGDRTITHRYELPRTITVWHVDDYGYAITSKDTHRVYRGSSYTINPRTDIARPDTGKLFIPITPTQTGTVSENMTVTMRYNTPVEVAVVHVDDDTNAVIRTDDYIYGYEKTYSFSPRTDLKTGDGYAYRALGGVESGKIWGTSKRTITMRYEKPRYVTVDHRDVDDNTLLKREHHRLYRGDSYKYNSRTDLKTSGGDAYKGVTASKSGTVSNNMTVRLDYKKPRVITVRHVDDDDDKVLATNTYKKYDGESYNYGTRSDLKTTDNYAYRGMTSNRTGTMNGSPITLEHRYEKPRYITIEHRDNDDNTLLKTDRDRLYRGDSYSYDPRTDLKTSAGDPYVSLTTRRSGTVANNMTVTFKYHGPRTLTVRHLDDDTGAVIASSTTKKYDGQAYSFSSRTDLKYQSKYTYYPMAPTTQSGTTNGAETFDFRYTKPSADFGFESIQIKTNRASSGLPVKFEFEFIEIVDRWRENDVILSITDKTSGTKVFDRTIPLQAIRDGVTVTIPSTHLAVNRKRNFEATLETPDEKKMVIIENKEDINTDGYTASEKVIRATSNDATQDFSEMAVSMTERQIGGNMDVYYETLETQLTPTIVTPTGYGFESRNVLAYENEDTSVAVPHLDGEVVVDGELVEGDYTAHTNGKFIPLTLQQHGSGRRRETSFHFPQTYVDNDTGEVFVTTSQPANSTDGGERLYIPIWLDNLGVYEYTFTSDRVGRNYMQVELTQQVKVSSYMFSSIDNDTGRGDAILIQPTPIFGTDPFEGRD